MSKFTNRIEKLSNRIMNFSKYIENRNNLFKDIGNQLTTNNIHYCFIGGAVLSIYNYERYTTDIDILIDSRDEKLFQNSLNSIGFRKAFNTATKKFIFKSIPVDIIFSGEPSDYDYPYPEKISEVKIIDGTKVNFVSLLKLVEIKMTSGYYGIDREKDIGDVRELIKSNNLKKNFLDSSSDKFIVSKYKELFEESELLAKMTPLERRYYIQNKNK